MLNINNKVTKKNLLCLNLHKKCFFFVMIVIKVYQKSKKNKNKKKTTTTKYVMHNVVSWIFIIISDQAVKLDLFNSKFYFLLLHSYLFGLCKYVISYIFPLHIIFHFPLHISSGCVKLIKLRQLKSTPVTYIHFTCKT